MLSSVLGNHILRALPEATLIHWLKNGDIQQLHAGQILSAPQEKLIRVHFPLTAILVWTNLLKDGATTAIAMVGREGAAGQHNMLGFSNHLAVQCAGQSLSLPAALVKETLHKHPVAHALYADFMRAFATQVSQTAVCNRHHNLEQQLIRLLLFTLDRSTSPTLRMTQEQMASMLGSRREGVTAAASLLQQQGLIGYTRGRITITNRPALERRACECCRLVSSAYAPLQTQPLHAQHQT